MRSHELHLHAIGAQVLDQVCRRAADAVDGAEGFGGQEDAFTAEGGREGWVGRGDCGVGGSHGRFLRQVRLGSGWMGV